MSFWGEKNVGEENEKDKFVYVLLKWLMSNNLGNVKVGR